jgi:hypothetical protein
MHHVKLARHLALITTAATLLAGTASAHAEGARWVGDGAATLTELTSPGRGGARVVAPAPAPLPAPPASLPAPAPLPAPPASVTAPAPAPTPPGTPPAASNATTQTITQVQVSTCVSHCDGGSQVQQAAQDNTTVQGVGAPAPHDGGSPVGLPRPATTRSSSANGGPRSPTPSAAPSPQPPGVKQVQVGCLAHCYGKTTLDTSGLTLAQVEQLLDELHVPSPPTATGAPGGEQHSTQQTAAQSENGDGRQSQRAGQTNGTIQVVVTPGARAGGGSGAAVVNQTTQGVVQLQVGCIFYCSRTRQIQQAQQSNATVQSVDGAGAVPVNAVSRVVSQVQVGCLAWCYDAVETQTATATDSTVVSVASPPDVTPPAPAGPAAAAPLPSPASGPLSSSPQPSAGSRTRGSGGAPVRVAAGGLALRLAGAAIPRLRAERVSVISVSAETGDAAALVSVAASELVQTEPALRPGHRARHIDRYRGGTRPAHAPSRTRARSVPRGVAGTAPALPDLQAVPALVLALALAAVGIGGWRRRNMR